mgnify:CR=1 FL=1
MMTITVSNVGLTRLLELTKRPQVVAGKPQSQVVACVLTFSEDRCSTTSLVRDGKTSLSHFSIPAEGTGQIAIPDIDRLLGVLKYHGTDLVLQESKGKLCIKSGSKQTTIISDEGGLAFPHSAETISEWHDKSLGLAGQINQQGSYKLRDGSERNTFLSWPIDSTELFEAFRCDNMNGQRLNRYTLSYMNGEITVETGDELKGLTQTVFECVAHEDVEPWQATFEGGLENVLKNLDGEVVIHFLDFRPEGQGIRLILDAWGDGYVFQASILM